MIIKQFHFFHPVHLLVTFFGVGCIKKAPGTMGSLATIPFAATAFYATDTWPLLHTFIAGILVTALIYLIGVIATKRYVEATHRDDPKEVVIDEVAGQFLTVVLSAPILSFNFGDYTFWVFISFFICNFLWFRFFDISKLWLIGKAEQLNNKAHAVMLDDIVAGIFAAMACYITYGLIYFTIGA